MRDKEKNDIRKSEREITHIQLRRGHTRDTDRHTEANKYAFTDRRTNSCKDGDRRQGYAEALTDLLQEGIGPLSEGLLLDVDPLILQGFDTPLLEVLCLLDGHGPRCSLHHAACPQQLMEPVNPCRTEEKNNNKTP